MMPATLDLPAVRRFTDDLDNRASQCDNGEGMICSTVEEKIGHYVQLCAELRVYVNQWAQAIFSGEIAFDQEAERLLREKARHLLLRAKEVAASGRLMKSVCYFLLGLDDLNFYIVDLDYLLDNWVSPRRAVSPMPRVKLSNAAKEQIAERLKTLPPLPNDWRPTDSEQLARFQEPLEKQDDSTVR